MKMEQPLGAAGAADSASPLASAMGDMPALAAPEALVVHSPTQNTSTFGIYGSTGLSWERTTRQRFQIQFSHSESSFSGEDLQSNDVASGRITASQESTPLTSLSAYAQVHHYFQDNGCTYYGSGIGLWHSFSRSTSVEMEGGPEYGSHSCGQRMGLAFSGKLINRIGKNTSMVFSGARDLSASYLLGSQWADYFEGAVVQQTGMHTSVTLSAGYLRSIAEFSPGATYSGYFVSPELNWRLNRSWNLLAAYRYFQSDTRNRFANGSFAINWIYITLQWRPSMLGL